MDKVTLTHEEYLSFTGWKNQYALKRTQKERMAKLKKMGMQEIKIEGKGTKSTYTFTIPTEFWGMLLIQNMTYSQIGADYINCFVKGNDVQKIGRVPLVKLGIEIIQEFAEKHGIEYKTAETTCVKIKKYLMEHDYLSVDESTKSHRVKEKYSDEWVTGTRASSYDQEARRIWARVFNRYLTLYKNIDPEATSVPNFIMATEARKMYRMDMARFLNVDYYRIVKRTIPTNKLLNDINYARFTFLQTHNLEQIRLELKERQEQYQANKKEDEEKEMTLNRLKKQELPSKEERESIIRKINLLSKSNKKEIMDNIPLEIIDADIDMLNGLPTFD